MKVAVRSLFGFISISAPALNIVSIAIRLELMLLAGAALHRAKEHRVLLRIVLERLRKRVLSVLLILRLLHLLVLQLFQLLTFGDIQQKVFRVTVRT